MPNQSINHQFCRHVSVGSCQLELSSGGVFSRQRATIRLPTVAGNSKSSANQWNTHCCMSALHEVAQRQGGHSDPFSPESTCNSNFEIPVETSNLEKTQESRVKSLFYVAVPLETLEILQRFRGWMPFSCPVSEPHTKCKTLQSKSCAMSLANQLGRPVTRKIRQTSFSS